MFSVPSLLIMLVTSKGVSFIHSQHQRWTQMRRTTHSSLPSTLLVTISCDALLSGTLQLLLTKLCTQRQRTLPYVLVLPVRNVFFLFSFFLLVLLNRTDIFSFFFVVDFNQF
jgi:hypothetical protein